MPQNTARSPGASTSGTAEACFTWVLYGETNGGDMTQMAEQPRTAVKTLRNYVNGSWVEPETTRSLDVTNPANGELLAQVPLSTPAHFPAWRSTPPIQRARKCYDLKYLLEETKDELALLVTRDNGKTLSDATGEVGRGIECVEVATGIPTLMQGRNLEDIARGIDCDLIRQPIGVFTEITPFNFPFMVPLWFLPFAVA